MRWALIKNSIVQNVIIADQNFIDLIKKDYDFCVQSDKASPGFTTNDNGKSFIPGDAPVPAKDPMQVEIDTLNTQVAALNAKVGVVPT